MNQMTNALERAVVKTINDGKSFDNRLCEMVMYRLDCAWAERHQRPRKDKGWNASLSFRTAQKLKADGVI